MIQTATTNPAQAAHVLCGDIRSQIDALVEAGAARFDPLAIHHINLLAARAKDYAEPVRRRIEAKLANAVEVLEQRFWSARTEAMEAAAQASKRFPAAADDLQALVAKGDFKALRRAVAALEAGSATSSLTALTHRLSGHVADEKASAPAGSGLPELKAVQYFRQTWSALSVHRQVNRALQQAPANAGPLNSHRLVVRSLELMRDISPEYLSHFVSYADTLLSLEQADATAKPRAKRRKTS